MAAELPKDEVRYVKSIQLTSPGKDKMYAFNEEIVIGFESKDVSLSILPPSISTASKSQRPVKRTGVLLTGYLKVKPAI